MINFEQVTSDTQIKMLADLAFEIWNEYWTVILTQGQIDYMVEKFQSKSAIENQIQNENYNYFFIKYGDNIVGYTGLCLKKEALFLSKLYIKKSWRHRGIGAVAFDFIKNFTKENNFKKITLTVNKNNANTINAYKKWGFLIVDSVITDIGNNYVMDDYIMEYTILNKNTV